MYIEAVPNRSSPPAVLLRESYREGGKVKKRTLANLSKLPPHVVEGLRALLRGGVVLEDLTTAVEVLDAWPWGHVRAVLGTARKLGLEKLLSPQACPERSRVLALIVARLLDPASKLATARGLGDESPRSRRSAPSSASSSARGALRDPGLACAAQARIEAAWRAGISTDGNLVLYDVTSSYFEGRSCPLARFGYNRDGKKGKLQIVFGLLCDREGCPVAVEVFDGNTGDPATSGAQIDKIRERFGLQRVVLVGDRGMITAARIAEELRPARAGLDHRAAGAGDPEARGAEGACSSPCLTSAISPRSPTRPIPASG